MKIFFLATMIFLSTASIFASTCELNGKALQTLKDDTFDVEFSIKTPFPPKLMEILEKYFGKFSKEQCSNSIVAAKIVNTKNKDYYLAFYTNEDKCDGGNSYGIIIKGSDSEAANPVATIEDSYIDCL